MRLRRHREPCATKAEASFTHSIRWREDQCLQVSRSVWSAPACRRFRTRAELRPLQMIMNASAKTPRALRNQSGSKLHALHTLARGSMLTGFAKRLECSGLPALSHPSRIATIANGHNCVCEDTASLAQPKRKQASRTPYAGARINAYRFREASGVLRLGGAFGRNRIATIANGHNCVCEDTASLAQPKRKQASRTPYAGARINAYGFREASGVLRLAGAFGPNRIATIANDHESAAAFE